MQEIELKFQIPEAALAGVQAELQALAGGPLTPLPLRAAYFDSPDRKLAAARSALRVRQEGDDWVQTLKAAGGNTMVRVEDNRPTQPPPPGQPIVAHLSLHADGPAQAALVQTLGWQPEHDPDGQAAGLIELYGTDIVRWRVQVTVGRGTPHEGVVELALDLGHIQSGPLRLPVRELEIESISGHPMAVIDTGRDWVHRHGLWLDTQTKAHRGDRLARQADGLRRGAPAPDASPGAVPADAGQATAARPVTLPAHCTLDQAWRIALEACVDHIAANMSELATLAPASPQAAAYAWRQGLRRLRALGRLWSTTDHPFPQDAMTLAAELSSQLGWWRDQEALAWLPERLRARGVADLPLPHPPCPAGLPDTIVALARSETATRLCLDLLAALLHPPRVDAPGLPAAPWLAQQMAARRPHLQHQIQRFRKLDAHQRHHLRQALRELRDLTELYSACWPARQQARHARALAKALAALGDMQDEAVALSWYHREAQSQAPLRHACEQVCTWLRARQGRLSRRAARQLQGWAQGKPLS